MKYFPAPWGWPLILISALATLTLAGISAFIATDAARHSGGPPLWVALLPLLALAFTAPFAIRGYTLMPGEFLLVHRLFWATTLPLAGLESASFEPQVLSRCLRVWGNGGLFAFSGFYWSRRTGFFRAFVTDLRETVVLRFPGRIIVVSPAPAEEFVQDITRVPHG